MKVQNLNGHQIIHFFHHAFYLAQKFCPDSIVVEQPFADILVIYHILYEHVNKFEIKLCST
jgi:hypothetical protein